MGEIIGVLQHSCSLAQNSESAQQAHILVIKLNKMNTNKNFKSTAGLCYKQTFMGFAMIKKSLITGQCIQ